MSDILSSVFAGGLAGIASCLVIVRFNLFRSPAPGIAPIPLPKESTPQSPPPTPAAALAVIPLDEPVAPVSELSAALFPLAEAIGHPRELAGLPAFQAVVVAFRRPDATLEQLSDHAFGANWPLACAAFTVLATHPDRQSLCDLVIQRLENMRPYVLPFALHFLASLDRRPPVGAAMMAIPQWWPNNPVIPGFFLDHFTRRDELGDHPDFGDLLEQREEFSTGPATALLQKVQHPFATKLLAALRTWEETRIDRAYLRTIGTLWDPADGDPLLVAPTGWRDQLGSAEAAIYQPRPRSVLISGDPRVGKTAFLKLLGERLQAAGWTIFSASGNELMADQMYIGQLEGRIRKLIDALHARRKLVWHVRDLGQLANSGTHQGQSASILDQILPAVTAGNLIIIGEASQAIATRLFQSRPSLQSVMEVLPLQPMDEAQTLALASELGKRITEQAGIAVSPQAVGAALELAQHYLGSGQLPGAVLELLKRAANRSINLDETTLTADSIVSTLSQISGLPQVILDTNQRVELARVHEFFASRVIGQPEAVKAIVDRIAMLKAGLTDPGRPIGVFLFAGPTGTGKTELAKTLADFLFGSADRLTRLDMSEFQTLESTSKIVGQRGDSGNDSLIDRIRKQPFSVVLLDEFEKAHPNCWDLFLQIFDDGRLSDANGREADFRHCIIILTSNLGATAHRSVGLGFRPDPGTYVDDQVLRAIGQTFRPEFVNRLDKIIVFRPLSRDLMRGILHKELAQIQERRGLRDRTWAVEWESSAIEFLLDRGFSPEMGARPLKRAIDQLLLAPLAATLVEHRFPEGEQFLFVRSDGRKIEVEFVDPDAEEPSTAPPDAEADKDLSLPAILLRQTGSVEERAALSAFWRGMTDELAEDSWSTPDEITRDALADPAFWSRPDRHRILSRIEIADRVREAARTADRLFERYRTTSERPGRASRELGARLALQLLNVRRGIDDIASGAPIDALLRVDPPMDAASDAIGGSDWSATLTTMYRQWAAKRRMQLRELRSIDGKGSPILHVTGFGAFRIMSAETGLHILDDPTQESGRRTVARVTVVGGPDQGLPEANQFAAAASLLAAVPASTVIVRRYRDEPAPMVRDVALGWRTGRLEAVLGGDFDLMGTSGRGQSAA